MFGVASCPLPVVLCPLPLSFAFVFLLQGPEQLKSICHYSMAHALAHAVIHARQKSQGHPVKTAGLTEQTGKTK